MARIAGTKEEVRAWFDAHPDARALVESTEIQWRCWSPEYEHDDYYRMLTVDDIRSIEQGGWRGEPGVFAWYYPCGVPTYMCVQEPPAIVWPDDKDHHSPETFEQMRDRHRTSFGNASEQEWRLVLDRHRREMLDAMWDGDFAHDAFKHYMWDFEYGYEMDDEQILSMFGDVTSGDYKRGIAELGLPERICKAYEDAAREVRAFETE